MILTVILALIGLAIWLFFKFQGAPGSIHDFLVGADGKGGFSSSNLKGWWNTFFGSSNDDDEYTQEQAQRMSDAIDNYQVPGQGAVDQALQVAGTELSDWAKTLETNPAALMIGSSPLF